MVALPDRLPGGGFGFWLEGIEPETDPAYIFGSDAVKRRFLGKVAAKAAEVWKEARAQGLDRFGKQMEPIGKNTRKARRDNIHRKRATAPYSPMGRARESNPPLQATGRASRTQSFLRWTVKPGRGVYFYWRYDPDSRKYWGEILSYHQRGFLAWFNYPGRTLEYVPARDVFGFSPAEMTKIQGFAGSTWKTDRPASPLDTIIAIEGTRRGIKPPVKPGMRPIDIVRATQPPKKVQRAVEWSPGVVTEGPSIRLPVDGPSVPALPPVMPAPWFAAKWRAKVARLPVGVQGGLSIPDAQALAGVIKSKGWRIVGTLAFLAVLVEFVREVDWSEVLSFFAMLDEEPPEDRDDAEKRLAALSKETAA